MGSSLGVPKTILVVEDEMIIRMDIAMQLEDAGYDVLEAASADEAVRLLEQNPAISLLVTDVDMPGSMNGLELAHLVSNRTPPLKIVVISGRNRTSSEIPEGSIFHGKPFAPNALEYSVSQMLAL